MQIKFSTKSFGIEAAEVAARAIENVANSLTHADVSDIIAGRPEKEVLGALQIISQALSKAKLKSLDLSDNALGQKGIIACTSAFAQQASHSQMLLVPALPWSSPGLLSVYVLIQQSFAKFMGA